MRLITRDTMDLGKLKNLRSRKDRQDGGSPIVQMSLNDAKPIWLTLDTGNSGGILVERNIAKRAGWLETFAREDTTYSGVNSTARFEDFVLPKATIGPYELENVKVSVPAQGERLPLFKKEIRTGSNIRTKRGKAKGLIGYDVLKHFVVTIDYRSGDVHIAPPAPESEPAESGRQASSQN